MVYKVPVKALLLVLLAAALVWGQQRRRPVISEVVICSRDGAKERMVYSAAALIESPNWSPDGRDLVWNSEGRLWRYPITGAPAPTLIPTGDITRVTLDHGISPDGKRIAISAGEVYTVPFEGGTPYRVLFRWPSYFHGWSPDGRTLVFGARRNNNFDIFSVPSAGGEEQRLTASLAYDGNPDCSPDGRFVYFNSDRGGNQDIWRIPLSGAGRDDSLAVRITSDEYGDWFPHPSPDGKYLLFLSFQKGIVGHPHNQPVQLRLLRLDAANAEVKSIKSLTGGQGTINANSWAPDSKSFAYIRYVLPEK